MEGEIDLNQLLNKIWKRKWLIVYITMACLIISGIVNFFIIQPVYEANVNIMQRVVLDQRL